MRRLLMPHRMSGEGWGVAIYRRDGTHFLCASGVGDAPALWAKPNRKMAVAHKRTLILTGFRAKVVPLSYSIDYKVRSVPKLK